MISKDKLGLSDLYKQQTPSQQLNCEIFFLKSLIHSK